MKNYKVKLKNIGKHFNILYVILMFTIYILHFPDSAYAKVDIGSEFGFGNIKSLGQGTSYLIPTIFAAATFLVILYFLLGAFKYLKAGGNKEEVEGGRQMMTHAIVGFIILLLIFFVIQFLLTALFGKDSAGVVNIFK